MRWLRERVMPARRGRLAGGGGVTAALAVGMAFAGGIGAALSPGSARLAAAEDEVPVSATPSCPGGGAGMPVDAPCTALKVHGNTYVDNNRNGRYDPNTGDTRLSGVVVKLLDPATGGVIGQAVTNADGYYSFPLLPVGPNYGVQVECPGGCQPTTPVYREFELRDFSTYWCCSARADFGCYQSGFIPGNPPPPPPGPPGLPPGKPPCCDIPSGQQTHIPILNYQANDNTCSTIIEVQNVGAWDSKALLVVWGAPGACPPQCTGPLKVECSGLLRPGSAWHFIDAQLPSRAKSGMVFSAPAINTPGSGDVFADLLCERLFHDVVGDCNEYRRFKKAYNEHGVWQVGSGYGFDFGAYPGASLAVEVVRKCPGDTNPLVNVTSSYIGLADEMLGVYDPAYGGYAFYAPLVYAEKGGFNSWLYVQNGGLECSSIEIWFQAQSDCLRPKICDILTLAPGETFQFDASTCVGPDWVGSATLRGSEPLSVAVDLIGHDVLMTYHGSPAELKYAFDGPPAFTTGSQVAYGPLLYSEYQGWDSMVQVQNLSTVTNARVKVYFLDRSGDVITTLTDWICPGGSQGFYLPVVADLPGNWVGHVRVESQEWFTPGQPAVPGPNITAVAHLVKYADVTRGQPLEAMAYALFSEQRAYDWQIGSGWGGLYSGVGRIGIPSFMKDVDRTGLTSEVAIANLVAKPGFTDFVIYIYDQNGLVTSMCEKLHDRQVEYLDAGNNMAFLPSGFKGSAVISAVYWSHEVFDPGGGFLRNLVGLAAVKVERSGGLLGTEVPGDESAANQGVPIIGPFGFSGPPARCPGVPSHVPCCEPPPGPGRPWPRPTDLPATAMPTPTLGVPTPPGPPIP
ncbi:hypothetical protein DCC79_04165 [bacterium]|nr:hypothetical protein [Chloroflexi bacterium CFX6]RIL11663.1 MAG: hypothetical protein DCC79_04165 [bacterium]